MFPLAHAIFRREPASSSGSRSCRNLTLSEDDNNGSLPLDDVPLLGCSAADPVHRERESVAGNMADWEPSVEELAKLATLKDVAQLVAMPTNVPSSLFTALGATGDEHPSVLGMMEAEEIAAEISGLKIEDKDLSIIQKGLFAGTEATFDSQKEMEDRLNNAVNDVTKLADETKTFTATHSAQPNGPQVPLEHVVSQGSEETLPKISKT